jgi:hypothetical protein
MQKKSREWLWRIPLVVLISVSASLGAALAISAAAGLTMRPSTVAALSAALSAIAIDQRRG